MTEPNAQQERQTVKNKANKQKPDNHWSDCFLEHAARETAWMREHAKQCNYASANEASIRRGVWLHAALIAKENGK